MVALAFGKSIGNMLDPRAVTHAAISVLLVIFSGVTIRQAAQYDSGRATEPKPAR